MKATEALRVMVKGAGKSAMKISEEIGRTPNYVASIMNRGSVPSVETFASIAAACGARLVLELPDQSIELDGWQAKEQADPQAGESDQAQDQAPAQARPS